MKSLKGRLESPVASFIHRIKLLVSQRISLSLERPYCLLVSPCSKMSKNGSKGLVNFLVSVIFLRALFWLFLRGDAQQTACVLIYHI
jgi:hypothetical protein